MKELIQRLVDGQSLSREDSHSALSMIMNGEATDAQIAAFLTALRLQGESADIIAGAAQAMREAFTPVASTRSDAVDTCGTGGDGLHTFNISTTAAFITAGAGVPVAKHGNRGVSSPSGSADVLKELGVDISIPASAMSRCLDEVGIAFLFAPSLHPAMKHAIGPRREIGIRTLFNVLGPLSNPASTRRGILGVYSASLVELLAHALADLGAEHMFVVHGEDGLDEISICAPTQVGEVKKGEVKLYTLTPEELGLERRSLEELRGGNPVENARITRELLEGRGDEAKRDIALLNAAAAICSSGKAADLPSALVAARESVNSGAALAKLEALIAASSAEG